jgi:Family of unknown function (DUF5947)
MSADDRTDERGTPPDPRAGGLGRFVRPAGDAGKPIPPGLKRFLQPPAKPPPPGEVCELCHQPISEEHPHVVNLESRALMCACRPCYLLFTAQGAGSGRFASVPDRYLYDPSFSLTDAQWDELQIPVKMAFFFHNSVMGKTVVFYPSPAGATESQLPTDTWEAVMAANPLFSSLTDDVEALLVYRREQRYECYLAPIDACYELVGRVRLHWKGFDGGQEAWEAIDGFFDRLRERSRLVSGASVNGEAGGS